MKKNYLINLKNIASSCLILTMCLFCQISVTAQGQFCGDPAGSLDVGGFGACTTSGSTGTVNGTYAQPCVTFGGGASIWYEWTAPADGRLNVNSINDLNNSDTQISITGPGCPGACIAEDDDGNGTIPNPPGFTSNVDAGVIAGQTYNIVWSDDWSGDNVDWDLTFTAHPFPTTSVRLPNTMGGTGEDEGDGAIQSAYVAVPGVPSSAPAGGTASNPIYAIDSDHNVNAGAGSYSCNCTGTNTLTGAPLAPVAVGPQASPDFMVTLTAKGTYTCTVSETQLNGCGSASSSYDLLILTPPPCTIDCSPIAGPYMAAIDDNFTWSGGGACEGTLGSIDNIPLPLLTGDCAEIAWMSDTGVSGTGADLNGASGFPLGTSVIEYFLCGAPTGCTVTVILVDIEGPDFLSCPEDVTIQLSPGDCDFLYEFLVKAVDECSVTPIAGVNQGLCTEDPGDPSLTNFGGALGGGVVCSNFTPDEVCYALEYDVQALTNGAAPFTVTNVTVAYTSTNGNPIDINIYGIAPGATPTFAGVGAPICTYSFPVPAVGAATVINLVLPTPCIVPAGLNPFVQVCSTAAAAFFGGGTIISMDTGGGVSCSLGSGGNAAWISGCNVSAPGLFPDFTPLNNFFPFSPWMGIAGQLALECIPPMADAANEYESGDYLPVGVHSFSFTATDPQANTSTCAWTVTVAEYDNPTESLTCNDDVNISIDNNCEALVTADMFLEGGPYACYLTGYEVYFSNDPTTNVNGMSVMLPIGKYTATVVDIATGNTCWGNFLVEDKTAPVIECVDITINCLELAAQGAVVSPCGADEVVGGGSLATIDYLGGNQGNVSGIVYFDITTNTADVTITALDMHTQQAAGAGTVDVYIVAGGIAGNTANMGAWTLADTGDGVAGGFGATSNYVMQNGVTLAGGTVWGIGLVISNSAHAYTNGNGANQQFSNADMTIDLGQAQNVPFQGGTFNPRVWNGEVYYNTLIPNTCEAPSDNCGETTLIRGEDVTLPQDCDSGLNSVVFRQWIVSDEMGNSAECQQLIFVERVGLADITGQAGEVDENGVITGADPIAIGEIRWPATLVKKLSCGDDTTPDGIYEKCSAYTADPISTICNQALGAINQHNAAVMASRPHYRTDIPYFDVNGDPCGTAVYLVPIKTEQCNLLFTYEDQVLPACGGDCGHNQKVIRTWTVLDWCAAQTATHVQIIKAVDNEAPTFVTATATMTATANPWGCMGTAVLPPVELHDNCDYEIDVDIVSFTPGVVISNGIAYNLPKTMDEPVIIVYTATDCCGNEAIHVLEITVVDATPPIPITKENVVISLTVGPNQSGDAEGIAKLFVGSIDNGSHDGDCGPVRVAIRRDDDIDCGNIGSAHDHNNNSTYFNFAGLPDSGQPTDHDQHDTDEGQYVKFCCEDLDEVNPVSGVQFGIVEVWLGVWDDANMDGIPGTPGDNFNESWSNVRVEAKLNPVILVPPTAMIECTDDPTDPAVITATLGWATAGGLCAAEAVEYTDVCNVDLNGDGDFNDNVEVMPGLYVDETYNKACNYGPILRTWCVIGTDICEDQIVIIKAPAALFDGCVDNAQGGNILWPYEDANDNVFNTTGGNIGTAVGFENGVEVNPLSPADATLGCYRAGGNAGYAEVGKLCTDDFITDVSWIAENCSLIGHSLDSTIFFFEADACLKIIYEHTVIDWCQYNPNDGTNRGIWTWTVVGKILDDTAPEITCPEICFAVQPECSTVVNLTATATDSLSPCPSEWIKWTVIVDMWGDKTGPLGGIADYEFSSYVPEDPSNGLWDDDNGNGIPDLRLGNGGQGAGADNLPNGVFATSPGQELRITLPENTAGSKNYHTVVWKAYDGCGNVMSKTVEFQVVDKKPPTPYCINLSTALMENGGVELWACDFNNGSFDNCTPQSWLRYSFGLDDQPVDSNPAYNPDSRCTSKTFTCEDFENSAGGLVEVSLYVWDECDNVDFCIVNLRLVDNQGACSGVGSRAMIAGNITTEDDRNVNDAEVMIMNDLMSEYPAVDMTADGSYAFGNNPMSMDYDLTASKNDDYLNGVSTLDLVLIQKHILGLLPLNSGYKMIAADVNNDSNVSSIDLIELRKLILGIYTELPANDSWRFADADKTVSIANPFPFAEVINVDGLDIDMMDENFVGIKIGDVNGSVELSLTGDDTSTEGRSSGKVTFVMEEQSFTANQVIEIPVTAENFTAVSGYQFTLANSKVELVNVTSGAINVATENFATINNSITTSWASKDAVTVEDGVLFTLTVKALENGSISNAFVMNSNITRAEAYTGNNLGVTTVELRNGDAEGAFELFQNEPNPFNEVTLIGFNLPESSEATLSVYDVTGKVIKTIVSDYNAGFNQVQVSKADLNTASGVLYYKLESGDYTLTKKMIIIE